MSSMTLILSNRYTVWISLRCFKIASEITHSCNRKIHATPYNKASFGEAEVDGKVVNEIKKLHDANIRKEFKEMHKDSFTNSNESKKIPENYLSESVNALQRLDISKRMSSILSSLLKKPLNLSTLHSLMKICAVFGEWKAALNHLNYIESSEIIPNVRTYSIIASSFMVEGQLHLALKLKSRMQKYNLKPDAHMYNTLFKLIARHGTINQALLLLSEMKNCYILPNASTYRSILSACQKSSEWQKAIQIFSEVRKSNIKHDIIMWNCLLDTLGRSKMFILMIKYFNDMKLKSGCLPNVITYNSLISASSSTGTVEYALKLMSEMKEKNIKPDVITYSSVIKAHAEFRDLDGAHKFFLEMLREGIKPDALIYTSLLSACAKMNDINKALEFFLQMRENRLPQNAITWNAMINVAHQSGHTDIVDVLYAAGLDLGIWNPEIISNNIENCKRSIDLHGMNVGTALAAVRFEIRKISSEKLDLPLGIITGWGTRGGSPVAKMAVLAMLRNMSVEHFIPHSNIGRIIVTKIQPSFV